MRSTCKNLRWVAMTVALVVGCQSSDPHQHSHLHAVPGYGTSGTAMGQPYAPQAQPYGPQYGPTQSAPSSYPGAYQGNSAMPPGAAMYNQPGGSVTGTPASPGYSAPATSPSYAPYGNAPYSGSTTGSPYEAYPR